MSKLRNINHAIMAARRNRFRVVQCVRIVPEAARKTATDKPEDRCYQESKSCQKYASRISYQEEGMSQAVERSLVTIRADKGL